MKHLILLSVYSLLLLHFSFSQITLKVDEPLDGPPTFLKAEGENNIIHLLATGKDHYYLIRLDPSLLEIDRFTFPIPRSHREALIFKKSWQENHVVFHHRTKASVASTSSDTLQVDRWNLQEKQWTESDYIIKQKPMQGLFMVHSHEEAYAEMYLDTETSEASLLRIVDSTIVIDQATLTDSLFPKVIETFNATPKKDVRSVTGDLTPYKFLERAISGPYIYLKIEDKETNNNQLLAWNIQTGIHTLKEYALPEEASLEGSQWASTIEDHYLAQVVLYKNKLSTRIWDVKTDDIIQDFSTIDASDLQGQFQMGSQQNFGEFPTRPIPETFDVIQAALIDPKSKLFVYLDPISLTENQLNLRLGVHKKGGISKFSLYFGALAVPALLHTSGVLPLEEGSQIPEGLSRVLAGIIGTGSLVVAFLIPNSSKSYSLHKQWDLPDLSYAGGSLLDYTVSQKVSKAIKADGDNIQGGIGQLAYFMYQGKGHYMYVNNFNRIKIKRFSGL
ncbi:MAG: hypothetical protein AAFW00_05125 [Bacteroidota bacterium]